MFNYYKKKKMKVFELTKEDLGKSKILTVEGQKVKSIERKNFEKGGDNFETIQVATDIDSIKVVIPSKGRWAPLVNPLSRKPYGFVFKKNGKKRTEIKIFVVHPNNV